MGRFGMVVGLLPLCIALGMRGVTAAEVEVRTLDTGPGGVMVFDPPFVKLEPGDSIKFVPASKGHNAESIKGMTPDGAEPFKTTVGREEVVTFKTPGVYGIKCAPHYMMGMVALVVVGDKPANLEAAKAVTHSKLATKRFDPLFAQIQ
jgi:pseudoazurin